MTQQSILHLIVNCEVSVISEQLVNSGSQCSTAVLTKGVDLTELLGDIKTGGLERDRSPPAESMGKVPQNLKLFCETTHNICIRPKIQQITVVAVIHFPWGSGHSFLCSLESTS